MEMGNWHKVLTCKLEGKRPLEGLGEDVSIILKCTVKTEGDDVHRIQGLGTWRSCSKLWFP